MFGKRKPNQKPEDDFESEGAVHDFATDADDDGADDGESWGDSPENGRDSDGDVSRSRGGSALSKVLPFAAIGFVAAAGAGYYYVNYMAAQPTAEMPAIVAADETPANETAPAVQATDSTTPAMPTDITQVETAPSEASETAVVPLAHISDETSAYTTENEASAPVPSLVAGDPSLAPAPAEDTATPPPSMEAVAVPAPIESSAPVETLTAAVPVVAAPHAVAPTPLASTSSPVPTAAVPAVSSPSVSADKLADMGQRLDVLEHQIDDLTKAVDRLASSQPSASPVLASTVSDLQAAVAQLQRDVTNAPRTATATSAPRPVASTTATPRTTSRTETTTPASPPRTSSNWVLRAAQDGEAWISPTAQGQLRHVKVGETISGLGRITAIELKNGRWVVSGTQGTVRQ